MATLNTLRLFNSVKKEISTPLETGQSCNEPVNSDTA
jgi:hypothetical protein